MDAEGSIDRVLLKRIIISIKLLLKENPVLPTSFIYKGSCLLLALKKQQKDLGIEVTDDTTTKSPHKDRKRENSTDGKLTNLSPGGNSNSNVSLADSLIGAMWKFNEFHDIIDE